MYVFYWTSTSVHNLHLFHISHFYHWRDLAYMNSTVLTKTFLSFAPTSYQTVQFLGEPFSDIQAWTVFP